MPPLLLVLRTAAKWRAGIPALNTLTIGPILIPNHPRLGRMGLMGKIKFMREVQYSVHYRLG